MSEAVEDQIVYGQPGWFRSLRRKILVIVVVAAIVFSSLLAFLALETGGRSQAAVLLAETVTFTLPNMSRSLSFSVPPYAGNQALSMNLTTPSSEALDPSNLTILTATGARVWQWPHGWGFANGFGPRLALVANNNTTSGSIAIPPGRVLGGTLATVSSLRGNLVAPYSLAISVGSSPVFSRNSSRAYLPPSLIPWWDSPNGTASASASVGSLSSGLTAIGEQNGYLTLYLYTPGGPGTEVFHEDMSAPSPLSLVRTADLFSDGRVSAVCAFGPEVSVVEETGGTFNRISMSLPPLGGTTAQVTGMALTKQSNGNPAIIVSATNGTVDIANWSTTGFDQGWNPQLSPLAVLPWTARGVTSAAPPTGSAAVAFGGGNQIALYHLGSSSLVSPIVMTLPKGVNENDLTLNSSGLGLAAAGSDGNVYVASAPSWVLKALPIESGSSPLFSIAAEVSGGRDVLAAVNDQNQLFVVLAPFSSSPSTIAAGNYPISSQAGHLSFAPLAGQGENDIMATTSSGIFESTSEAEFNGTVLGQWPSIMQTAINDAVPNMDNYGNPVVSIPVNLSVSGGSTVLRDSHVFYNYSASIKLPPSVVGPSNGSGGKSSGIAQLILTSGTPGEVHLQILSPGPPPPQSLGGMFLSFANGYGPWLAVGTLAIGVGLLAIGHFKYGSGGKGAWRNRQLRRYQAPGHDPRF